MQSTLHQWTCLLQFCLSVRLVEWIRQPKWASSQELTSVFSYKYTPLTCIFSQEIRPHFCCSALKWFFHLLCSCAASMLSGKWLSGGECMSSCWTALLFYFPALLCKSNSFIRFFPCICQSGPLVEFFLNRFQRYSRQNKQKKILPVVLLTFYIVLVWGAESWRYWP